MINYSLILKVAEMNLDFTVSRLMLLTDKTGYPVGRHVTSLRSGLSEMLDPADGLCNRSAKLLVRDGTLTLQDCHVLAALLRY